MNASMYDECLEHLRVIVGPKAEFQEDQFEAIES